MAGGIRNTDRVSESGFGAGFAEWKARLFCLRCNSTAPRTISTDALLEFATPGGALITVRRGSRASVDG
jgi:hypothetical protein